MTQSVEGRSEAELKRLRVRVRELEQTLDNAPEPSAMPAPLVNRNAIPVSRTPLSASSATGLAESDRFFNLALDLLCVIGRDGYLRRFNPAFEKTLGFASHELISRPLLSLVHPDDRAAVRQILGELADGEAIRDFESRHRRRDDAYRLISWRVTFDVETQTYHGVARDITEQRALQLQVRQVAKMNAIGQLAGGIAHDFNNLLLSILGNTDFATRCADKPEKLARHLSEIKRAGAKASELTRQLLTFSRRQPLTRRPLDLNDLTENLVSLLDRLIPENINIDFQAGADLAPVLADASQLEQVVMNLCVNARDAMPDGGTISITTGERRFTEDDAEVSLWAKPGNYVVLSVSDRGVGITAEVREHMFEPFYTTKALGSGTGVGLATVYGVVEQHGGLLNVVSEPGSGALFEIFFPICADLPSYRDIPPSSAGPRGSETVLLAEDDDMVRSVVVGMLQDAGYRVHTASDGEEAVQLARRYQSEISVVLLDVVMPKLSGPEVFEKLQQFMPQAKFLFSSGYTSDHRLQSPLPEGIPVFEKPYTPGELLRNIRHTLDTPSQ